MNLFLTAIYSALLSLVVADVPLNIPKTNVIKGVKSDENLLRLSATVAGRIYEDNNPSKTTFQKRLSGIDEVKERFPKLKVHFLYHDGHIGNIENQFSDPPFAAITTGETDSDGGETLILVWRGSSTAKDWFLNLQFDPTDLASCGEQCDVQGAYYDVIKQNFNFPKPFNQRGKGSDIVNLIENGSTGKPVKRVILTGHSLGGALAQVAHAFLTSSTRESAKLSDAIMKHGVEIYTVAFSAPMSVALKENSKEGAFKVQNMMNFVYNMDPVPRLYGGLDFVTEVLEALNLKQFLESLAFRFMKKHENILDLYRHFGTVFYYKNGKSDPEQLDNDALEAIDYNGPKPSVAYITDEHMNLVKPGFGWGFQK